MRDYVTRSKFTTKPRLHYNFSHPLHVHTVHTWVFFKIVLLWDLVHAKIYKFEIRKRGLVVKLVTLR